MYSIQYIHFNRKLTVILFSGVFKARLATSAALLFAGLFRAPARLSMSVGSPSTGAFFTRRRPPILRAMTSSRFGRPRRTLAKLVATAAVISVVAALASSARALGPRDRHLTSVRHGVSVEAPAGWTLSQHSGYGDTVAVMLHPTGGRISVTASPTTAADGRALFEQNQQGLLAQKMVPAAPQAGPHGFTSVDIAVAGRSDRVRQLYLVRPTPQGKQGVILTLVCRDTLFAELVSALAFVADRLELDDPAVPPPASSSAPHTAGAGGAGPPPTRRSNYAAALAAPPSDRPIDISASGLAAGGAPGAARGAGGSGGQLRAGHGNRKPGS